MTGLLLAAVVLGLSPGCASPRARRGEVTNVAVTDTGGYVELVARRRENEIESKVGTSRTRSEESIFEQSLALETDGYVYHPNLLEFSLAGLFGLLQHDFQDTFGGRSRSSSDDGTVNEFDVSGRFFKKKAYPGSIFARRYRALEPRPFQSSLDTTTNHLGLVWQYVSKKAPTSLQFSHTDVLLDPLDQDEEEGRQQNTNLRFQTAYRFSDHNVLSLTYDRRLVEEEPFAFNYDSDEVTLAHRLDLGEQHRHTLESELNFFDQRGTFSIERARWREVLRLRHSETLTTTYTFELADRTQGSLSGVEPLEEVSSYLSAMLEHQLYESLISQFTGFAQMQDFKSGPRIDRLGALAAFDYRKRNRWGILRAKYQARLQQEDRSGSDRVIEILDERHTLTDPNPAVLTGTGIQSSSIGITDLDRTQLYQLARDYTIEVFPDRVEIRRVPTGRIADGESVLVNYRFTLRGDFAIDTFAQHFAIRQDFKRGFSPYYRLRWQDQSVSPASAVGAIEDDVTAHILGLEFRWKPLRIVAEFEDHDSTVTPFQALRLSADLTHRFKTGGTGRLKTRWMDITREDVPGNRETRFFTLEGRYRHPITRRLTVEGTVLYRSEEDSVSGTDEGIDLDLSLEWFIRRTELRITYEFGQFEDDFARSDHSAVFVHLRRRF